jgi:predicted DNA-binding transcriptional regulator YafY
MLRYETYLFTGDTLPQITFEKTGAKWERLSYIYDRLMRTPDGVTITELAGELGVSTKTIQRDLHEALAGAGVYCDGRRWKLNRSKQEDGLGATERIVLGVLDSLAKNAGTPFYTKAHKLLEQVSHQLEHPLFASVNSESLSDENLLLFTNLEKVIKAKVIINLNYITVQGQKRSMRLKPLKLAFFEGFWYLLVLDAEANDSFKKLHLKSIRSIEVSEETFAVSADINEKILAARSVWFELFKEPFTVILFVEKEAAPYFERKPFPNQNITGQDKDGSIEVTIQATHEMEIIPFVLWYLPYIHIMKPTWLAEKLEERMHIFLNKR